jgi:hypothetical protein
MKKNIIFSALLMALLSCNSNSSSDSNAAGGDTTNATGLTNPSAIDTTKHPDGVINGSVISTDTAAMNVQNSINKAKEAKKNK